MGSAVRNTHEYQKGAEALRVLVLDDDAFDRKRLRRMVERSGNRQVQLLEAADLAAFATHLTMQRIDLVLVDYGLQDGTGLDALMRARATPNSQAAFVVMVSGREDDKLKDTCLAAGCDAFLTKSDLGLNLVGELLDKARAQSIEPEVPHPSARPSAVEYWAMRGRLRANRSRELGKADTVVMLTDLMDGMAVADMPESDMKVVRSEVSAILRAFITDFLSEDAFVFQSLARDKRDLN